MPGSDHGVRIEDPTIGELLHNYGYVNGQFGKNHLGDLNRFLPTVRGFDEFFGNLYHLNAEEEPENPDYPKEFYGQDFKALFGPRGVLDCVATDVDDATIDPRWGTRREAKVHGYRSTDDRAHEDRREGSDRQSRRFHGTGG